MCGFAGLLAPPNELTDPEALVRSMTRSLEHRGPDTEGFFVDHPVFLGHRRLQVIDLEGGVQPFVTKDVVLAYNGEIYNYKQLRAELASEGVSFRTESDTEVLAEGFARFGTDFLSRLNGMFAFALWDKRTRTLTVARDRMGQKPLYIMPLSSGWAFASELRALQLIPGVSLQVSATALRRYFLYDFSPAPNTIFENVACIEPGHWRSWGPDGDQSGKYWNPELFESGTQQSGDVGDILSEAVRLRLRSDVPLGISLSGGIDSSLLVALAAQHLPASELHTFSVGFEEASYDESNHARLVAEHFGTQHHEQVLSEDTMLNVLPKALDHLDEPFADGSFLPTYLLSEFTRQHVTVTLGGDGGDELFMGYPTFFAHRLGQLFKGIPSSVWKFGVSPLVDRLPVSERNISLDYQMKRFSLGMQANEFERHFVWIGSLAPWKQSQLLSEKVMDRCSDQMVFEPVRRALGGTEHHPSLHRLSLLYAKLYLADDILVKVDRASMAHGLEARAPFLDHHVVEAALRLPINQKLRGKTTKAVLRDLARTQLPEVITRRPKKGFGMPIAKWLRGPLKRWASDLLDPVVLGESGFFVPEQGMRLLREHCDGKTDHRKALWSLLVFSHWWQRNKAQGARFTLMN